MCASLCVGLHTLSSVVKRNQTVLSYAHAGVSENSTTHSLDDMHTHTTTTSSEPNHSWCVINRQRIRRCWGGLLRCRVEEHRESPLTSSLPSRRTDFLWSWMSLQGKLKNKKVRRGKSVFVLLVAVKQVGVGVTGKRNGRKGMNNKMCTHERANWSHTEDKKPGLCADILVCAWGRCEPGQREMFSVLCCTSIMEACCIMTAQTVGILSLSSISLIDLFFNTSPHTAPPLYLFIFFLPYSPVDLSPLIQLLCSHSAPVSGFLWYQAFVFWYGVKELTLKSACSCANTHTNTHPLDTARG